MNGAEEPVLGRSLWSSKAIHDLHLGEYHELFLRDGFLRNWFSGKRFKADRFWGFGVVGSDLDSESRPVV